MSTKSQIARTKETKKLKRARAQTYVKADAYHWHRRVAGEMRQKLDKRAGK